MTRPVRRHLAESLSGALAALLLATGMVALTAAPGSASGNDAFAAATEVLTS